MRRIKKPKPLGACTVCRALTDQHEDVNHRCRKVVNGRRCAGVLHSNLTDVWDECLECGATGFVGTQVCASCEGFGWRLLS